MEEDTNRILDLSRRGLKKVPKEEDAHTYRTLILDENDLQKIDNIDSYLRIESLSLAKNQLLRMYGVCRLHNLRDLNLSYNGILTIEGLKDLHQLRRLTLAGNNIKTIEHLNTNHCLTYLNLNDNSITNVGDLSYLKDLQELHLSGNRITHLRQCEKYLPGKLAVLDLGRNNITDLNEICTLVNLVQLNALVIADNPCVQMVGSAAHGFDYRPFVLNWCMTLQSIDGFAVTPIESLKAEWLYSQGRGRQFRVGEQAGLCRYLASCCPLNGEALESDSERKLRLILSKAQQHQKQLQDEILHPEATSMTSSMTTPSNNSPATGRRRGVANRLQSPRFQSRIGVHARQGSPPETSSMISSYHGNTSGSALDLTPSSFQSMSTSLIENIKKSSSAADVMSQSLDLNNLRNNPLAAASKMMPVPESLMSPIDCGPAAAHMLQQSTRISSGVASRTGNALKKDSSKTMSPKLARPTQVGVRRTSTASPPTVHSPRKAAVSKQVANVAQTTAISRQSSEDDDDDDGEEFNEDKLRTIRDKAAIKTQQNQNTHTASTDEKVSAILIQKIWRGYSARKATRDMVERIHKQRTNEYIKKLTCDMEVTKDALENERKIQQLQMQAINALWKKVSAMQGTATTTATGIETKVNGTTTTEGPSSIDNVQVVQDLAQTCSLLTNQVQQLQGSMRDILTYMSMFANINPAVATAIQTIEGGHESTTIECQTEIVAVHTPQAEQLPFPFQGVKLPRPSTLPLDKKLAEDVNAEEASEETLEKMVREQKDSSGETGGGEGI